ncbi:10948_t:CDS:1 [Ambispora leptoticha]|uniref:10948_t:CDS:1 n=1 Tax=Ambispora leptoticha TaxID=144679 RepID=A0A9N9G5Y7_9GLOM|nr:10948_t:CDS:1 [Ambispora leptoticha]
MDNCTGPKPILSILNSLQILPIRSIRCSVYGKENQELFSCDFHCALLVAITIHKSQGLTLPQTVLDIGNKEFVIGLTFVVRALSDFNSTFSYYSLQKLETSTRL